VNPFWGVFWCKQLIFNLGSEIQVIDLFDPASFVFAIQFHLEFVPNQHWFGCDDFVGVIFVILVSDFQQRLGGHA
jgi:hypothetical protein